MPPVPFPVQVHHAWNPDDSSLNIFVKESDPMTLHRRPVAQSTDCIRTKIGYTKGIHLWEVNWNSGQRGTHAVIGVATDKSPLHCVGYQSLIGIFFVNLYLISFIIFFVKTLYSKSLPSSLPCFY